MSACESEPHDLVNHGQAAAEEPEGQHTAVEHLVGAHAAAVAEAEVGLELGADQVRHPVAQVGLLRAESVESAV